MKTSEKLDQLLPALAKARLQFGEIKKTKENPHYHSKYAALDDILPAIDRPLAAEGLLLLGDLCNGAEGVVTVTTRLMHISEQWIESTVDLTYQFGNLQKLGGEVTYARRYSINTMLQLAADDDLDERDGSADGMTRVRKSSAAQKPVINQASVVTPEPNISSDGKAGRPEVKLTTPEITRLLTVMQECYQDETRVDHAIRGLLKIPVGQVWNTVRLRHTLTRAQYQQLQDEATAFATQSIAHESEDDVPLTAGPESSTMPQDARTGSGEYEDISQEVIAPAGIQNVKTPMHEVLQNDPPEPNVDDDGEVLMADMKQLIERAACLGTEKIIDDLMKRFPVMNATQWKDAWGILEKHRTTS